MTMQLNKVEKLVLAYIKKKAGRKKEAKTSIRIIAKDLDIYLNDVRWAVRVLRVLNLIELTGSKTAPIYKIS